MHPLSTSNASTASTWSATVRDTVTHRHKARTSTGARRPHVRLSYRAMALVATLGFAASLTVAAAQSDGTITIDVATEIGTVGPYVYGANYGPLSVVPVGLFDAARASGITFLRFPGGNYGDVNDVRPFDIDMLMTISRLIGAEPSIHVRLQNGTPEAAAALVRYTIDKGYDVRHWYIGNEPSLFADYSVDRLNREWRAIADAMLEVDPDIVLIGPEPHQWTGLPESTLVDENGVEWVDGFLRVNGDLVDIVAVHRYPFPRSDSDPTTTVADLRENTLEWTDLITRLRAVAENSGGRTDYRYGVTEANSHWSATTGGEATNDSLFNAVWWADVLGKLITDGAYMVNYFDLQSPEGRGGWGLLGSNAPRPSYYVYQLYQRFGSRLVAASSDIAYVSVYAALRDDGGLSVIVTNLNDESRTADFTPTTGARLETALLLDADHLASQVPDPRTADMTAITLPARSVTLLVFAADGSAP